MNTWLWVAQGLMAAFFGFAGVTKLMRGAVPKVGHQDLGPGTARLIGTAEIAGAVGLVLPILLAIAPWLTVIAAAGLLLVMALAMAFHLQRKEYVVLPFNLVVAAILIFIIAGRWGLFDAA